MSLRIGRTSRSARCAGLGVSAVLASLSVPVRAQPPATPPSALTDIVPLAQITQAPAVFISNGMVRAKIYLPDAENGFYRGVRFDWAGMIGGLTYKGHDFYTPWFQGRSKSVRDFAFQDGGAIAAPNTAANGPVEEFNSDDGALGYGQAQPGGHFVKIGVGVLQRIDAGPFAFAKPFPLIDAGRRTIEAGSDRVAFTQSVSDPSSGYGYSYTKRLRLAPGSPTMIIEHVLKNTGSRIIVTYVYDHNFLNIDGGGTPKGLQVSAGAPAAFDPPSRGDLAEASGGVLTYKAAMGPGDRLTAGLKGFGPTSAGYSFHVVDPARGVGVRITGDLPVDHAQLWSIAPVMAIEPFVKITVKPGESFRWSYRYDYEVIEPAIGVASAEHP